MGSFHPCFHIRNIDDAYSPVINEEDIHPPAKKVVRPTNDLPSLLQINKSANTLLSTQGFLNRQKTAECPNYRICTLPKLVETNKYRHYKHSLLSGRPWVRLPPGVPKAPIPYGMGAFLILRYILYPASAQALLTAPRGEGYGYSAPSPIPAGWACGGSRPLRGEDSR